MLGVERLRVLGKNSWYLLGARATSLRVVVIATARERFYFLNGYGVPVNLVRDLYQIEIDFKYEPRCKLY